MSYSFVRGQQTMALDERRNLAYLEALKKVITPDSVVLDLGAGLGIHGLLAAQLGAKRVYLVEPEDIITVADAIAKKNGFGDRVKCLHGKIEEVEIPEPVDVIVSVFTGNFLIEEDLLPSLFYARDRYLKPGGVLIPEAGIMQAVPVSVPNLYEDEIGVWSTPHLNLDPSPARSYVSQSIHYCRGELANAQYLAEPTKLMALDFYTATSTHCNVDVKATISEAGTCHGWAGWFNMLLGDTWLSTAPHEPLLHWSAAFLPIDPPVDVEIGEDVSLKLQRPPHGDWTWHVKFNQTQQQKSTLFGVPMTLKTIRKAAHDYQPHLSDRGKAILYVLSHSDGTQSVESLSQQIRNEHPALFSNSQQALNFVQNLTHCFA
ncbi:MAG: methyltransferase domain-containing protein [Myxacorys californica WJT36-NPBG1]|jgi:hypothetical protein|nr:methyltransferase domain-containing protein [Myxacorys californica WJT36-NPBG1]